MKKTILKLSIISFLSLPFCLNAGENISVGGQVGLFGVGANAKYKINDQVGVRAGFDMININDYEVEDDEITYNFDLQLQDFMVVGDYHPWNSSFKTSFGVIVNNSNLDGDITPTNDQEFEIQGHIYSTNDIAKIDTKVDFDPVAPYFGIGWDTSFDKDKGFGFTFDIGVIYQGAAKVDYSVNYKELVNPTAQEELARQIIINEINKDLEEEKISLQDELDKYEWLPYISIGVNYKF